MHFLHSIFLRPDVVVLFRFGVNVFLAPVIIPVSFLGLYFFGLVFHLLLPHFDVRAADPAGSVPLRVWRCLPVPSFSLSSPSSLYTPRTTIADLPLLLDSLSDPTLLGFPPRTPAADAAHVWLLSWLIDASAPAFAVYLMALAAQKPFTDAARSTPAGPQSSHSHAIFLTHDGWRSPTLDLARRLHELRHLRAWKVAKSGLRSQRIYQPRLRPLGVDEASLCARAGADDTGGRTRVPRGQDQRQHRHDQHQQRSGGACPRGIPRYSPTRYPTSSISSDSTTYYAQPQPRGCAPDFQQYTSG
ncbi:hypothetical protein C8R44DRAFT_365743 [Mycena epipterygia]|nr:hypothetical protein C8R44DRAFT_365743 [Mycena epipterygia]